jgi:hypothetical protein
MRHHLTYANMMATIAVFIALGGGAFAAVSSIAGPDGVIHGCYGKQKGNLRVIRVGGKCGKGEKAISFNQVGRRGLSGLQGVPGTPGAPGSPGATGERGPQGPGATSFSMTLEQTAPEAVPLKVLDNGVSVVGTCRPGTMILGLGTEGNNLATAGTATLGTTVVSGDAEGGSKISVSNPGTVDLNLIARDVRVARFARIDVHGTYGAPCKFSGMITPSG